jgi:hypothetical protein
MANVGVIAQVCHEANRAWCEANGDTSQQPWHAAEEWQWNSAIEGVRVVLENPDITAAGLHERWCESKRADGWTYGVVKDAEAKTHPCLVPYDELPEEQRRKDALFRAIVIALA